MRVVFLGTPRCAVPTLEALIEAGHEISSVVTQPDRPAGRSGTPRPSPVKTLAAEHRLNVLQPRKLRRERTAERLAEQRPDALVVVAYGKILPKAMLEVARLAPINVHFSLLPRYRGAAPVQWALAAGETTTGVTTMWMNEGLDEGDVLLQREVPIEPGTHAPALLDRLATVGASLLLETLAALEAGTLERHPQDHALATYAPLIRREHAEPGLDRPAADVANRIRAFDPWPGVWVRRGGRRLRLVEAEPCVAQRLDAEPGQVLELRGDALVVACGGGTLLALRRLQPEGRRIVSAVDAVNGRQLRPGDRLDGPPSSPA